MGEKVILFSEDDTMFRLMETALNGEPSERALDALHYFFGDTIKTELDYLVSLPSKIDMSAGFRAVICSGEDELESLISDADYLVCERTRIGRRLMVKGAGKLKMIQKFGGDYRNIDLAAAKDLRISVSYMPRVSTRSVAEHVMALILSLSRNLIFAHCAAKNRKNATDGLKSEGPSRTKFNWGNVPNIRLVHGKKLGLVGFGENAKETAKLAFGLGMEILYYKRNRVSADEEQIVDARFIGTLKELVQQADFVSIHVPYNSSTEKMFDQEIFSEMKADSFLISGSRGGIVDENALIKVLSEKKIAGAALDVYRWEPVPSDCPLLDLDNVVWTTHNGGGAGEFLLQECCDVLVNIGSKERGEAPKYLVVE